MFRLAARLPSQRHGPTWTPPTPGTLYTIARLVLTVSAINCEHVGAKLGAGGTWVAGGATVTLATPDAT